MKKIVRMIAFVLIIATLSLFMVACTGSNSVEKKYEKHFKNLLALVSEDNSGYISLRVVTEEEQEDADGMLAMLHYQLNNSQSDSDFSIIYCESEEKAAAALLNGRIGDEFVKKGVVLYDNEAKYKLVSEKSYTLDEEKERVFDMAMLFVKEKYSITLQFQVKRYKEDCYCYMGIINKYKGVMGRGGIFFFSDEDSALEYWLENKQTIRERYENAERDGDVIVALSDELKEIYDNK